MKKRILFIISNMESGGVSKSMSSLLNVINTDKYEVDCFILSPKGLFLERIPNSINIIRDESLVDYFSKFPNNLIRLFLSAKFRLFFMRLISGFLMLINKGWGGYVLSRGIKKINKKYDLAVDYNGQHQLYYLVDKINSDKKVTFFHSDYKKWAFYYKVDKKYFPKVDKIFTISDTCVDSLKEIFPDLSYKIEKMENISSIDLINKMANEKIIDEFDRSYLNLLTIGHISKAKGSDLAINSAKYLKEKGIRFKWYFIGAHTNKEYFEKLVEANQLSEEIIFLGLKSNPYPYIKTVDIVVHPSTFEGRSIALDEAKLLCKPIIVTNFSTVNDQFTDRFNASICNFDPKEISDKIIELFLNESLRHKYITNLRSNIISNEFEIRKLYNLLK